MATKDGKQWWDPYETSNNRQFAYRPNSAAEIQLRPKSTSFIDSYSQSGPFGSTVYNKEFCWKPACKPECICTGTASGQRRNNPHPSQSFMVWRRPRDAARSSVPSEGEMRKALTAQYSSIYKCDYMGMPQGHDHISNAERRLAPLHIRREMRLSTETEMRDSYRLPKQKPELLSHYSCSTGPNVACHGIVPTVVQRHTERRTELTTYNRFYGNRDTNIRRVIKSLLPKELKELQKILPKDEKEYVKAALKDNYPNNMENVNKLPVVLHSCSQERI